MYTWIYSDNFLKDTQQNINCGYLWKVEKEKVGRLFTVHFTCDLVLFEFLIISIDIIKNKF